MAMKRELWKSHIGFMWAAIGSAVGLGSIWRFPYIVGQNGGAAFIILFAAFLVFVSLPVLIAEIVIGRKTHLNPSGAYRTLGKKKGWGWIGLITILTGFIVSSFYSVICGWTLGYLGDAIIGGLTHFKTIGESQSYFNQHVGSPVWAVGTHFLFMFLATVILFVGVQKGIEASNKIFMPMLFIILMVLVVKGITMVGGSKGLAFLFAPDWKSITPAAIVMALGQALFGLSIGQGTMVTYGSYLETKENIPSIVFPIAMSVIIVSLLAGIAIFTVVFSVGATPDGGTNLMFQTLPMIFSQITGGYFLSILFFLLIFLAGLTSQISAMEPLISYFMDEKKWSRHKSTIFAGAGAFLLGVPSALSFGIWKGYTFFGMNFFDAISYLSINIMIPFGGLAAVILVGWKWGLVPAFAHLREGTGKFYQKYPSIDKYLRFNIKYLSPVIIIIILLNLLGVI
jgi:NSS family neurotransmitter:Na+ symporter